MRHLCSVSALSLLIALPPAAAQAQLELEISADFYWEIGFKDDDVENDDDFEFDEDTVLQFGGTADNGLRYGFEFDVDDLEDGSEELDEAFLFVRGSFGEIQIGEETEQDGVYTFWNRYANDDDYRACEFTGSGLRPSSARTSFGYVGDLSDRERGSLATEFGGSVVNPAFYYGFDLSGVRYGFGTGFCVDTGYVVPAHLNLYGFAESLDGSDEVSNQFYPNGLGVTGVGTIPGVFVPFPTDLLDGAFDVERNAHGLGLTFSQPLGGTYKVGPDNAVTRAFRPFGAVGPNVGFLNLIGGIDIGSSEQHERSQQVLDTPLFGFNSRWTADYATDIEMRRIGLRLGLGYGHYVPLRNGDQISFDVSGTVGVSKYSIDVTDHVRASGLGGALAYNERNELSFEETLLTASLSGSFTRRFDGTTFGVFVSWEYGHAPQINYHRPDSNLAGPLDPTLEIEQDHRWVAGFFIKYSF